MTAENKKPIKEKHNQSLKYIGQLVAHNAMRTPPVNISIILLSLSDDLKMRYI